MSANICHGQLFTCIFLTHLWFPNSLVHLNMSSKRVGTYIRLAHCNETARHNDRRFLPVMSAGLGGLNTFHLEIRSVRRSVIYELFLKF